MNINAENRSEQVAGRDTCDESSFEIIPKEFPSLPSKEDNGESEEVDNSARLTDKQGSCSGLNEEDKITGVQQDSVIPPSVSCEEVAHDVAPSGSASIPSKDPFWSGKTQKDWEAVRAMVQHQPDYKTKLAKYEWTEVTRHTAHGQALAGFHKSDKTRVEMIKIRHEPGRKFVGLQKQDKCLTVIPVELDTLLLAQECDRVVKVKEFFQAKFTTFIILELPPESMHFPEYVEKNPIKGKLTRWEDDLKSIISSLVSIIEDLESHGVEVSCLRLEDLHINPLNKSLTMSDLSMCGRIESIPRDAFPGTKKDYPPEFRIFKSFDPKQSVVFSLGVVLFKMLNGCLPPSSDDFQRDAYNVIFKRVHQYMGQVPTNDMVSFLCGVLHPESSERLEFSALKIHTWIAFTTKALKKAAEDKRRSKIRTVLSLRPSPHYPIPSTKAQGHSTVTRSSAERSKTSTGALFHFADLNEALKPILGRSSTLQKEWGPVWDYPIKDSSGVEDLKRLHRCVSAVHDELKEIRERFCNLPEAKHEGSLRAKIQLVEREISTCKNFMSEVEALKDLSQWWIRTEAELCQVWESVANGCRLVRPTKVCRVANFMFGRQYEHLMKHTRRSGEYANTKWPAKKFVDLINQTISERPGVMFRVEQPGRNPARK